MFTFAAPDPVDKPVLYAELAVAARAMVAGEEDAIANMANIAALIGHYLPDLNWAGFYRLSGDTLILGPFQGKPACIRIPVGKGVCGAAAQQGALIRVDDVHSFTGHIACDAASTSEIVVPVFAAGRLVAVLDLDSPVPARFDAADEAGLTLLAATIGDSIGESAAR